MLPHRVGPRAARRASLALAVSLLALLSGPRAARSDLILTRPGMADDIVIFRDPTALPEPPFVFVSGLPAGDPQPHGVDCYGGTCIVADFRHPRLFIVDAGTATVTGTLDTPSTYTGKGSVAVNRAGTFVLATSTDDPLTATEAHLAVIATPVTPASTVGTVPLPGIPDPPATLAIVFDPQDRAFVCHRNGVSVLEPPYEEIAFTIPLSVPPFPHCVALAVTPDGNTLLVPETSNGVFEGQVRIFEAPFSAASTYERLRIPDTDTPPFTSLNSIAITPDGSTALLVSTAGPDAWAIAAPFTPSSAVERIPLPPDPGGSLGFEDVAISPDGGLAVLTGQGNLPSLPFLVAPFTAAGVTAYNVPVSGGRGAGAARFVFPTSGPSTEVCGDCLDNDANGLTDFEDPSCCAAPDPLAATLRRARLKPGGATSKLSLSGSLAGAQTLDPRQQDVRVQLRREDTGAELFCATLPAESFAPRGKAYKFRDKTGAVAEAKGVSAFTLKPKKDGSAKLKLRGARAALSTPPEGALRITFGFDGAGEDRCAQVVAPLTATRKGVLRFP